MLLLTQMTRGAHFSVSGFMLSYHLFRDWGFGMRKLSKNRISLHLRSKDFSLIMLRKSLTKIQEFEIHR